MKFLPSLVALLLAAASANAQVGIGPELGFNASGYNHVKDNEKVNTDLKYGGRIGVVFDWGLSDHLYLQPAALYVTNGYKEAFQNGTKTFLINTIEVPINLEYKFSTPEHNRFFVGAGPFIGFNKAGAVKTDVGKVHSRRDILIGTGDADEIIVFDLGAGVNGGYELSEGFYVRLRAQMGFLNIQPHGDSFNSLKSYNFGISFGYLFGGR